jgi:hypothetical protein
MYDAPTEQFVADYLQDGSEQTGSGRIQGRQVPESTFTTPLRLCILIRKVVLMADLLSTLQRLHDILQHHPGDSAAWIASIIELCGKHDPGLYRALNSKRMWGGAGSIANQALADNPGMNQTIWHAEIREFRELMIELGNHLQQRGNAYPDISSWMLAFSNWNQSGL